MAQANGWLAAIDEQKRIENLNQLILMRAAQSTKAGFEQILETLTARPEKP